MKRDPLRPAVEIWLGGNRDKLVAGRVPGQQVVRHLHDLKHFVMSNRVVVGKREGLVAGRAGEQTIQDRKSVV